MRARGRAATMGQDDSPGTTSPPEPRDYPLEPPCAGMETRHPPAVAVEGVGTPQSPTTPTPVPVQAVSPLVTGTARGVRRKRGVVDKTCRICGDRALAHNFDVITCESCKAFFRRNAAKRDQECAFQRSCPINVRTRRFCSACRLKKCLAIGMRADLINDKKQSRKAGPKVHKPRPQPQSPTQDGRHSVHKADSTAGTGSDQESNGTKGFWMGNQHSPKPDTGGVAPDTGDFQPVPPDQLPPEPAMYWQLTDEELGLLADISATYQNTILRLPPQAFKTELSERALDSLTLEDLLGRCDVCATNVVKLMKGLADYRTLQVEDQLSTLKACAMRTLILKGAACFVVERDAWLKAHGHLPVSLFVRLTGRETLIRRHAAFCRSLKTLLGGDVTMYALLQCVVLFEPQEPAIADRPRVNALRDKYLLLLRHYLQARLSYRHADRYLQHLHGQLAELAGLAQRMTDMFREWTGLIQPLMLEVLSLT